MVVRMVDGEAVCVRLGSSRRRRWRGRMAGGAGASVCAASRTNQTIRRVSSVSARARGARHYIAELEREESEV